MFATFRWIALLCAMLLWSTSAAALPAESTINAAIGDVSWVVAHGTSPSTTTDEVERIRTHLHHVIALLDIADTSALSSTQRANRHVALRGLLDYTAAGVFPRRAPQDGYRERRPRFIDDRGVHCAVGEMIRRSGRPELARAIDADWEYAYVPEIESPELAAWAQTHGFTARELAMIQPTYRPGPTSETVEADLLSWRERWTMECAQKNPATPSIDLQVQAHEDGAISVDLLSESTPFATCMAKRLQSGLGGRGWGSERAPPFSKKITLPIVAPRELIAQRLKTVGVSRCSPRPGALSKVAVVHVMADKQGLNIEVTTEPSNPEVDACLVQELRTPFHDLRRGGHWAIDVTERREIMPAVNAGKLSGALNVLAVEAGWNGGCYKKGPPEKVTVHVTGKLEGSAYTIEVKGGKPAFEKCFRALLKKRLPDYMSVSRKVADGSYEKYFRIDAAIDMTHTIELSRYLK